MTLPEHDEAPAFEREKIVRLINSVVQQVSKSEISSKETIFNELEELQALIKDTRSQIGGDETQQIAGNDIPQATDELDAVLESTAEASGNIMDSCEAIQEIISDLDGDKKSKIEQEVIKIFEACSFQDITGQRITKVVKTLAAIEQKIAGLLSGKPSLEDDGAAKPDDPQSLMNGPQLPQEAITQDDIDKLLEEFD